MTSESKKLQLVLDYLKVVYEEQMPFNKLLGVKILSLEFDKVVVRIDMKDDFVGNYAKNILHGGVISSVLDLTSGLAASMGVIGRMKGKNHEEIIVRFAKMGTIDMRVDYLTAGRGEFFLATGEVLRTGNKVAVIRTEFANNEGILIAVGTASYIIG